MIDIESTIAVVKGYAKQGAAYCYTHQLGYDPLLATMAGTGEVLHSRLRKGSPHTARGIIRFVDELLARLRRAAGESDVAIIVRADSGFYQHKLLNRLSAAGVGFSVAIPQRAPVTAATDAIAEGPWQRIDYPRARRGRGAIYQGRRLIVRRVPAHHSTQGQLFAT